MNPANFTRDFHHCEHRFTRIGTGHFGGKAKGLLQMAQILEAGGLTDADADVRVTIPHTLVIATDCFDEFMTRNGLYDRIQEDMPDDRIAHAFLQATLPTALLGDLRAIAEQVRTPLAIRSSSLLEDAIAHPFAGVYATVMLPNHLLSTDHRAHRLTEAIQLVYASTFFASARRYIQSTGKTPETEKMAVLIQEVVGVRHDNRFYPDVSGVARSWNYYPFGHGRATDGVVQLALGLGKTIVDGFDCWSYCPAYPLSPPPYKDNGDMLKHSQTRFWAIDMSPSRPYDPTHEEEHLVHVPLSEAAPNPSLRHVASTWVPESDRLVNGIGPQGPRVITFSPILSGMSRIALNETVKRILGECRQQTGTEVEIEWAANLSSEGQSHLFPLQMREMAVSRSTVTVSAEDLMQPDVIVSSSRVLGHGERSDMMDILYVRPDRFETRFSRQVATELNQLNATLAAEQRPYMLIGFGRFGTTDPWMGIPVDWGQISSARVIVEAALEGITVDFSQGSHFFHNMTSCHVSYFAGITDDVSHIDWDFLQSHPAIIEGSWIRHIRLDNPFRVRVDTQNSRGVVLRCGNPDYRSL